MSLVAKLVRVLDLWSGGRSFNFCLGHFFLTRVGPKGGLGGILKTIGVSLVIFFGAFR